jgi:uncharacterized protein (DUF2235 family)
MKRIAVFCDGTWNKADQPHPTNVRRLAMMVPPEGRDGVKQLALYFQGVGVPESGTWLQRLDEKISGGAMGVGLDNKIAVAYQHLGRNYEPGDEVYVFGFSRGAYTARSLGGLIRNAGLPHNPSPDLVRECFDHYRDRTEETAPGSEASMAFRYRVSPGITTGDEEIAWRRARGLPEGHPFRITYMGVWDTVGALGIPSHWGLPARLMNRKYRFHDTELSRFVRAARHAVAIDEERRTFVPTLWTNLAKLRAANPDSDYRQEWFAGVHSSVGGGGDIVALSALALLWIADGAMAEGLTFSADALQGTQRGCNLLGPLYCQSGGRSLGERILGLAGVAREGPGEVGMVSHPAVGRWREKRLPEDWRGKAYRPKTLSPLEGDLGRFDLASIRDYSEIRIV